MLATDFKLEILWNVFLTKSLLSKGCLPWSSGWSWKEFCSMLWALWVVDLLLDLSFRVLWCISPMPAPASPFASWLSMGRSFVGLCLGNTSLSLVLQHILKLFLFPHLRHFFAPSWAFSWVDEMCCICCLSYLGNPWLCSCYLFYTWRILISSMSCCCHNSTIRFVSVEVFYCIISCSLACLMKGCVCDVLSPLLQSDPLFDFKMFCCVKKKLCPMYHFLIFSLVLASCPTRSFMCWSSWSVVSYALPVLCHCTSRRSGSSRRLTLLEYLQWPWILPWDSFGFPRPLKWAVYSTIWNLTYLGNLQS